MYSSDTINIAAENKRKNRQPEYCVRRPFKVCDGCVQATLGITTVTRGSHPFPHTYIAEQRSSMPHYQGQPIAAEGPKAKLAVFDGSGDWESFLVPFERQARKYGWSGDYRVDCLYG